MTGTPRSTVAVTGLGLMTGLGLDLESSWSGLLQCKSPIRRFSLFDPGEMTACFGVELPAGAEELFARSIKKRHRSLMTRGTMLTLVTARMALADAGLDLERLDRTRVGVAMGATGTGYVGPVPGGAADEQRILKNMANAPASWISLSCKLAGPSFTLSTACSSGAYALASAFALIQGGLCDVVVSGAGDSSLNLLDVQGFAALMALSEQKEEIHTASRPFDQLRGGFVMGEGAGVLILEQGEHARARGARIYAEMPLPGLTSETYNIISPEPGGRGMARAMRQALQQAGLEPEEVDYINAHGTSTQLNDLFETRAIKEVFGSHAASLPVSSTKSLTGHCLAAAAGVEAVICCKALTEQIIPPTAHLVQPDPELDLDYVPHEPRRARLRHVMCNSFAFGGHNAVCLFNRPG